MAKVAMYIVDDPFVIWQHGEDLHGIWQNTMQLLPFWMFL